MMKNEKLLEIAKKYGFSVAEDIYQIEKVNTELDSILEEIYAEAFGENWDLEDYDPRSDAQDE